MPAEDLVVDASAVLALLQNEPFRNFDPERIIGARISTVNLCEVLSKLQTAGLSEVDADRAVSLLDLRLVDFDAAHAKTTARLAPLTKAAGLSLGDRACLATGKILNAAVVTADKAWSSVNVQAEVIFTR